MKTFAAIAALLVLTAGWATAKAEETGPGGHRAQLWLAPQSLTPERLAHDDDFLQMFTPNAPWKIAAEHTAVFKFYGSFLMRRPQSEIDTVVADLNRRHIAIALEIGVLDVPNKPPPACGGFGLVEGYGTTAQAARISQVVKAAGGEIKYLVMDEPLYYGHYSTRQNPRDCQSPIAVLLQQMAPIISTYRSAFPDIIFGEVEPTRLPLYPNWEADYRAWAEGVRRVIGQPLAFVQLDVPWSDDGKRVPGTARPAHEPDDAIAVYSLLDRLRREHLVEGIGIIHDGTRQDATDAAWVDDAKRHVQLLEGERHLRPDQDIFQSWMPQPSRALPETAPDTLTGLVAWFVDPKRPR